MDLPTGGGLAIGPQGYANQTNINDALTITDNLVKVRGKHTLKTGFMYRLEHGGVNWSMPTVIGFTNGLVSNPITGLGGGNGLSEFLMGAVMEFNGSVAQGRSYYDHWRYWAAYVQDDFRVTPRLTLNLGLRWDLYGWSGTRLRTPFQLLL